MLMMTTEAKTINRVNYGMVFHHAGQLHNVEQSWHHTFQVQLPDVSVLARHRATVCDDGSRRINTSTCNRMRSVLTHINLVKSDSIRVVTEAVATIKELIPDLAIQVKSRQHRALLPFIGDLSHSLFGTATSKEVNILKEHINTIVQQTNSITHSFSSQTGKMQSYMTAVDNRMTNIMRAADANHKEIGELIRHMSKVVNMVEQVEKYSDAAMSAVVMQTKVSHQLEQKVQSMLHGVYSLMQGKLSPSLIPPSVIHKLVDHINHQLSENSPGFHILHTHSARYYDNNNFVYARHNDSVYITLSIPVTSSHAVYQLYRAISFPVALNHTTMQASQLVDVPQYVAVSKQSNMYMELDSFQYDMCSGERTKYCSVMPPQRSVVQSPSCVTAIFFQHVPLIKQLCDFKLIPGGLKPQVTEIEPSLLLLSDIKSVTFTCPQMLGKVQKGCSFCVISVPCKCSVHLDNFFIPARLNKCNKTKSDKITHLHPVNLAWLHQFFTTDLLSQFGGEILFNNPVNFSLPNFKLFETQFSQRLAADHRLHLSLSHIAEDAQTNKTVLQTVIDPIYSGEWAEPFNVWDIKHLVTYISIAFSTIACIISVKLAVSLKKITMTLTVLQQAHKTTAMSIGQQPPKLVWHAPTDQPTHTQNSNTVLEIAPEWIQLIVGICLVISLITLTILVSLKLFKHCQTIRTHTKLQLCITNGHKCAYITLLNLPLCPSYWDIPDTEPKEIHVNKGCPTSSVNFQWTETSIPTTLLQHNFMLPHTIKIPITTAHKIETILSTPFTTFLQFVHQGYIQPLPTADTDSQKPLSTDQTRSDPEKSCNVEKTVEILAW